MTALHGPGKYDDLATHVRARSHARAVLVIVIDGDKGHGFSVQGDLASIEAVPDLLDQVSGSIRLLQQGRTEQ